MTENIAGPRDVLDFWRGIGPQKWYARDDEVDRMIGERFGDLWRSAAAGHLDEWAGSPDGALALLILLDQFSRNLNRGSARAFAQDAKARAVAQNAIRAGFDRMADDLRQFFYLPFMHSESIADQARCVRETHALGAAETLRYARIHEDIIRRFGRFPHRNAALGRHTTPAERDFLADGGFAG